MKNELQVYTYLKKYLNSAEISNDDFKKEMEQYLVDTKDRFHKMLNYLEKDEDAFQSPSNIENENEKVIKLQEFLDRYIEEGSEKIDHIKDLLVPEWHTDYINAAIGISLSKFIHLILPS